MAFNNRPQSSYPHSRPAINEFAQQRPQTQQVKKRNTMKSHATLPRNQLEKPQSALPKIGTQSMIRIAQPGMKAYDVSAKYWDIVSKQMEMMLGNQVQIKSKRPMTAYSGKSKGFTMQEEGFPFVQGGDELFPAVGPSGALKEFEEKLKAEGKTKKERQLIRPTTIPVSPFDFLSKLGGHMTDAGSLLQSIEAPKTFLFEVKKEDIKQRPATSSIQKRLTSAKGKSKPQLLMSRQPLSRAALKMNTLEDRKNAEFDSSKRPFSAQPNLIRKYNRPTTAKETKQLETVIPQHTKENDEYAELGIEEISDNAGEANGEDLAIFEQVQDETYSGGFYRKTAEQLMSSRPTTAHLMKQDKEDDLGIFPDLFDRSERTKCATFAKYGNLTYVTPLQRIGQYMDYGATLKRQHLINMITYLKTTNYLASLSPGEKRTPEEYMQDCLFHGCMKEEKAPDKGKKSKRPEEDKAGNIENQVIEQDFEDEIAETAAASILEYDPENVNLPEREDYKKGWSKALCSTIEKSYKRYLHYIEKDEIRMEELSLYNKKWIVAALEKLGDESILRVPEEYMRDLYQEIINNFLLSTKRGILNYLLLCPMERKRLEITILPRTILPSADKLALTGGYSNIKYANWAKTKQNANQDIKLKLLLNNIVISSLQNWFHDFRGCYLLNFNELIKTEAPYCIGIEDFFTIQREYRRKMKGLFLHIWHRGAIMILRQFKYLKKQDNVCGKFTLKRYVKMTPKQVKAENIKYYYFPDEQANSDLDKEIALEYSTHALMDDFIETLSKEELIDIRDNQAYINHVRNLKGTINFSEDGYKSLTKEYRVELKYAAGNLLQLQMRQVIEKSLSYVHEFFMRKFGSAEKPALKIDFAALKIIGRIHYESTSSPTLRRLASETALMAEKKRRKDDYASALDSIIGQFTGKDHKGTYGTRPIFRLNLEIQNKSVNIKEAKEFIIQEMNILLTKMIKTFDKFIRPEFAKIVYVDRKQVEFEDKEMKKKEKIYMQLHSENEKQEDIIKLKGQRIYKKYCANIKIEESAKDVKMLEQEKEVKIFSSTSVNKKTKTSEEVKKNHNYILYLERIISKYYDEASQVLKIFQAFSELVTMEVIDDCKAYTEKEMQLNLEEYEGYFEDLRLFKRLLQSVPNVIFMTMFEVHCSSVKNEIMQRIEVAMKILQTKLEGIYIDDAKQIAKHYKNAVTTIQQDLKTPEEVQYIESFKASLYLDILSWQESVYKAHKILFKLLDMNLTVSDKTMRITKKLYLWPSKLRATLDAVDDRHKSDRASQEQILKERRDRFEAKTGKYSLGIHSVETFAEIKDYQKYMVEVLKWEKKVNKLESEREIINKHENCLFGYMSPFEEFIKLKAGFMPHCELWKSIEEFDNKKHQWMKSSFASIVFSEMEVSVKTALKVILKSQKSFDKKSHPTANVVIEEYKKEVEEVQRVIPSVEALSRKGLKPRHWEKIKEILSAKFDWKTITLKELMVYGIVANKAKINEISEEAEREFSLEQQLQKMIDEWNKQEISISIHGDADMKVFSERQIEELKSLFNDHLKILQTILSSPYVKPIEDDAIAWNKKLKILQNILEKWFKLQGLYFYLHPILGSPEFVRVLSADAAVFMKVDAKWHELMDQLEKDRHVIQIIEIHKLTEVLDNMKKELESAAVSLHAHIIANLNSLFAQVELLKIRKSAQPEEGKDEVEPGDRKMEEKPQQDFSPLQFFDDKDTPISAIGDFAKSAPNIFASHLQNTLKVLSQMWNCENEGIRKTSVIIMMQIVESINLYKKGYSDSFTKPIPGLPPKIEMAEEAEKNFNDFVFPKYLHLLKTESSFKIVTATLSCLSNLFTTIGPAIIYNRLEQFLHISLMLLKQNAACQAEIANQKALLVHIVPFIQTLVRMSGDSIVTHLPPIVEILYNKLQPPSEDEYIVASLSLFGEFFKCLPQLLAIHHQKILVECLKCCSAENAAVTRVASWCIGNMVETVKELFAGNLSEILQGLKIAYEIPEQKETKEKAISAMMKVLAGFSSKLPFDWVVPTVFGNIPLISELEENISVVKGVMIIGPEISKLETKYSSASLNTCMKVITEPKCNAEKEFKEAVGKFIGKILKIPNMKELVVSLFATKSEQEQGILQKFIGGDIDITGLINSYISPSSAGGEQIKGSSE